MNILHLLHKLRMISNIEIVIPFLPKGLGIARQQDAAGNLGGFAFAGARENARCQLRIRCGTTSPGEAPLRGARGRKRGGTGSRPVRRNDRNLNVRSSVS